MERDNGKEKFDEKVKCCHTGAGPQRQGYPRRIFATDTEKFQIKYVVDPLAHRRERAQKEYGCQVLESYTELFGKTDIDFVVNATPSHLHYPIAMDLMNHGLHVLVEKPFAKTVAEVDALIEAAGKNGVMLAVFQQSRFAPYYRQVRNVIDSGVLGRLIQVSIQFDGFGRRWDWQCCQCFNGGSLYNTGPHPVDQALDILGDWDNMPTVFSKLDRVNTFGDAEDYAKLILTAPGKPLVDVEISSCNAYPSFTYNISGSQGSLKGTMDRIDWKYFKPEEAPEQKLIKTPLENSENLPAYCSEALKWYEESWSVEDIGTFTDASAGLYQTIYDHLTQGAPLVVTPRQVRQQIAVMEEVHRQNPLSVFA